MLYIKGVTNEQQDKMRTTAILYPDVVFGEIKSEWLDTPFSRAIIQDVDKLDVSDVSRSVKDILGYDYLMLPSMLATGTKNVLVCRFYNSKHPGKWYYNCMGLMGENCFPWLMQAAAERDIHMITTVYREFSEDCFRYGGVHFDDLHRVAHNAKDFSCCMSELANKHLID